MSAKRIAIVGAGIVGVSTALFLQRDGHEVVLVDRASPGTGTSLGNAGVISVGSVLPVATPGIWRRVPGMLLDPGGPLRLRWSWLPHMIPWLWHLLRNSREERVDEISSAIVALTSRAWQAHQILIQQCGAGDLVRSGGWLKVAKSTEALNKATRLEQRYLTRNGVAFRMMDGAEARALEPALSPDIAGGLLIEDNRAIRHPLRYTECLMSTFLERGGVFERQEVRGLSRQDGQVDGVTTAEGKVAADIVVIAAGAFSRTLAAAAGHDVPLDAERGYHVMLPHLPEPLGRPVQCLEHGFVLIPMEHGTRLTTGVEFAGLDAPPDYSIPRRLLPAAKTYVPGLVEKVESEWLGFRPSLPDSLPVIGRSTRDTNVVFAFGHQHIGLTLGPITGRIVADLIAGRDPGIDLAPYRPDRAFS